METSRNCRCQESRILPRRKVTGNKMGKPKEVIMWAAISKTTGAGIAKSFRTDIMPRSSLDARSGAIGIHVFPTEY
jgi:hypothetical protein